MDKINLRPPGEEERKSDKSCYPTFSYAIKNYYNVISKGYDELYGEDQKIIFGIIVQYLRKMKKEKFNRCLDAGCGTGIGIKYLKPFCRDIIGIDFSKKMIEIARNKYPRIKFLKKDLRKLIGLKKKFDAIFLVNVLQDYVYFKRIILNIKKLSKRHALIVISVTCTRGRNYWKNKLEKAGIRIKEIFEVKNKSIIYIGKLIK